jgi:putative serine protease PepD
VARSRAVSQGPTGLFATAPVGERSAGSFPPHRVLIGCRATVEAMNENQQPGIPDFTPHGQPSLPNEESTVVLPNAPYGSYTGADFPAPAGVPPLNTNPAPRTVIERPKRRTGTLLAAAGLAAVLGAGAGIGSYAFLVNDGSVSPVTITSGAAPQSPAINGTVTAAAAKIEPSLVTIAVQSGGSGGIGSGVVLDKDGHILTNNHVIAAAAQGGEISVTFHNGTTATAKIIGTSESNDLAVIKVDGVNDLNPATFAKSSELTVGQTVVAAGAPLGLAESVTSGIVSNTARPVRSGNNNDAVYLAVQTDAAINPGNSGGPLVDLDGAVVGINSSIASTSSGADGGQPGNIGIGFAIPSDVAARVANELITSGKSTNAALGVTVAGSDSELSTATGVSLQQVVSGGAAEKAGLHAGDVVTKIDDFHTTTPDGLIAATRFYAPGTTVSVTFIRDGGSPQTAEVTLGTA